MTTSHFAPGTSVPVRLLKQLDELRERKVALLTATAGSGKSSLARTWLTSDPELDNHSFAILVPSMDAGTVDRVRIAVAEFPEAPLIVILVDHHDRARDQRWLGDIVDFADTDARIRVILAGRMRPDVPLSALAIRGQLIEISSQDLALTRDEQRELLIQRTPDLTEEMLDQIVADYAGWPIAIELLGNAELTASTVSSARTVIDGYLREEVLAGITDDDLDLLTSLSTLPEFTPAAAGQLTGRHDASARLTYLSARGLPLEWHSGNRIRFNPALRRYLERRLAEDPERELLANRRTARWLHQQGKAEDAIRHAASAHDRAQLGELLSAYVIAAMPDPSHDIDDFLSDVLAPYPNPFALQLCQISMLSMRTPQSVPLTTLTGLEREYRDVMSPADRARLYAIALFVARQQNYQRHTDLVERAVEFGNEVLADENGMGLSQLELAVILVELGTYHLLCGDTALAERALGRAIAAARMSGVEWLSGWGLGLLAYLHAEVGRAPAANRLAHESLSILQRCNIPAGFAEEPALFARITTSLDRGRIQDADEQWAEFPSMLTLLPMGMAPDRAVVEANLHLVHDNPRAAVGSLTNFLSTNPTQTADQRARIAHTLAQANIRLGSLTDAERAIALLEGAANNPRSRDRAVLLRARLSLSNGRPEEAYKALTERLNRPQERQLNKTWLNLVMTYGVACNATDRSEEALQAFQSAGALAESLGLNAPNARHTQVASSLRPDELRLTTAERNVLGHLAGGAKLSEIAEALYISPNTLKTHLRRIYRKLNVSDRNEAVARARSLGIRSTGGR